MGRSITCQSCKTTFFKINKLRKCFKKYGNKIAEFACDQCTKTYRDKYWLNNHKKTDHPEPDQDVRAFICPKYGKSLRSPQSLKTHRKFFCHSLKVCHSSIIETSDIWFQKFESGLTGFKFLKPDFTSLNIHFPYECIVASLFHLMNGHCFSSLSKRTCIGDNSDRVLFEI